MRAKAMKAHLATLGADPSDNTANANVGMVVYGAPFQTLADATATATAEAQRLASSAIGQQVAAQRTSGLVWAVIGAGIASVIGLAFYFGRQAAPRANPRKRRRTNYDLVDATISMLFQDAFEDRQDLEAARGRASRMVPEGITGTFDDATLTFTADRPRRRKRS